MKKLVVLLLLVCTTVCYAKGQSTTPIDLAGTIWISVKENAMLEVDEETRFYDDKKGEIYVGNPTSNYEMKFPFTYIQDGPMIKVNVDLGNEIRVNILTTINEKKLKWTNAPEDGFYLYLKE